MKLLITTLTMIFLSFGALGDQNIGTLYKYCKAYQNENFEMNSLKSVMCRSEIRIMVHEGDANCQLIKHIYKKTSDKISWETFALLRANDRKQSMDQVIMSFINFAEQNPQLWNKSVINNSHEFLGRKFPCKLNE